MDGAQPVIGEVGTLHMEHEDRVEVLFESWKQSKVLTAMCKAHPYEKVAYDIYQLENEYDEVGSGIIGELTEPTTEVEFLQKIKKTMMSGCVRHTKLLGTSVKTVAVCGGSGSFLLNDAKKAGADVFVTADFKYHEFFDAEGKVVVADIGHYESEQFTIELIRDLILEKFPTFAVRLTGVNTNPVGYL
jgi:putative NIF3 family GTP cyclohydrolase 1 type 2